MEFDYQTPAILPHPSEWHDRPQHAYGAPNHPPISYTTPTSPPSQRRRSSAAHTRPAAPPPNLPIPRIPDGAEFQEHSQPFPSPTFELESYPVLSQSSFARPGASPNLTAVATFSQSRMFASAQQTPLNNLASSVDDLSDPPPASILPPSSSRIQPPPQQLPSPPTDSLAPPTTKPPSSRRALTQALELARQAVDLDSTNDHPGEAIAAYARSVALLSEVMERVRRGETSEVVKKGKPRVRDPGAQAEEIQRLQTIHDTYADRMNILSTAYSIPPIPYTAQSLYPSIPQPSHQQSTHRTGSPTTSGSPSSDSHEIPHHPYTTDPTIELPDDFSDHNDFEAIGTAMFSPDLPSPSPTATASHPYAAAVQYDIQVLPNSHRLSILPSKRLRGSSVASLPPAHPPPANSLPPAPLEILEQDSRRQHNDASGRQRVESTGHRRTGSGGRLGAVEEHDETALSPVNTSSPGRASRLISDTIRNFDSPLPPLPSPTYSDGQQTTPRNTLSKPPQPPPSPRLASIIVPRPRGSSTLSVRQDPSHIINTSVGQGTIIQRRAKTSAPPTPRSSSPAESVASAVSTPRSAGSSFSAPVAPGPVTTGRLRSSSQPGRRPSVVNGRISPLDRPPLPNSIGSNAPLPRKTSIPSKLGPNGSLSVQTDFALGLGVPSNLFNNLPTTPISPLPPAAPNDPLRKPYHLMHLLRNTMTSATGGYITRRLHVPQEVWSQGGAKLANLIEKIRVVGILCAALDDIETSSTDYFGAGNVSSGMALGIGSLGRKEGEAWINKLEEFSSVCDGVVASFGKKLGVGEGFVVKKTTWSEKFGRRFDKFTNGKNLDSPAAYVNGLKKLFMQTQLLDEHTKAVTSQPLAPAYASFPPDIQLAAEAKLKRTSEFFASVVLTFVIRDLSQLLDKYAKKCEKWMAE